MWNDEVLAQWLDDHAAPIDWIQGRLWTAELTSEGWEWIDVTGWSLRQAREWMGY